MQRIDPVHSSCMPERMEGQIIARRRMDTVFRMPRLLYPTKDCLGSIRTNSKVQVDCLPGRGSSLRVGPMCDLVTWVDMAPARRHSLFHVGLSQRVVCPSRVFWDSWICVEMLQARARVRRSMRRVQLSWMFSQRVRLLPNNNSTHFCRMRSSSCHHRGNCGDLFPRRGHILRSASVLFCVWIHLQSTHGPCEAQGGRRRRGGNGFGRSVPIQIHWRTNDSSVKLVCVYS